jgi:hypothetical protein
MEYYPALLALVVWGLPFLFYPRKTAYILGLFLIMALVPAWWSYSLASQGKKEWAMVVALFPLIASFTYALGSIYGRTYIPT